MQGSSKKPPKKNHRCRTEFRLPLTGKALVEALRAASITYTARDYGGFEKVGALGRSLPASDSRITTQAGDVILYSGNQLVLFYGSNSWSYTRIGKMEYGSMDALKSFLKAGEGDIRVFILLQAAHSVEYPVPQPWSAGIRRFESGVFFVSLHLG